MKRLVLALCLLHCNSSKTTAIKAPPNPGSSNFFYTLTSDHTTVVANGNDHATLTVNTRDDSGKPLAGTSVTLAVTGTNNVITPASAATDTNGNAVFTFSSTVAETKSISAGNAGPLSLVFVAGAATPSTSKLTLSPSSARANGTAAVGVTITLADSAGNVAAGAPLTLSISGSENTPQGPISAVADARGSYSVSLTSTVAEDKNILLSFAGGTLSATANFHDAWVPAPSGLYGLVEEIVVDPGTPETIYAGGVGGVFRSTDDGVTWSAFNAGLAIDDDNNQLVALAIDVTTGPHTLYAASTNDIYRMRAGDAVWEQLPGTSAPVRTLAADKGVLFAGGTDYNCFAGCQAYVAARSDDAPSWHFFATVPAATTQAVTAIALDTSTSPDTVYIGTNIAGSFVMKGSVEDGASVFDSTGLANFPNQLVIGTQAANPLLFAAASDGKVYTYSLAGHWVPEVSGLAGAVSISQLALDATSGDLYASDYGTADGNGIAELPVGASTWQQFNAASVSVDSFSAIALGSDEILLAGLGTGLLSFPRTQPSNPTSLSSAPLEIVTNDGFMVTSADGTLYVLTLADEAADWRLYVSADNGSTWSLHPATIGAINVSALVAGDKVYAATFDTIPHVVELTDSAWSDVTNNLDGTAINDLELLSVGGQTSLFAATDAGIEALTATNGAWVPFAVSSTGLSASVSSVGVAGATFIASTSTGLYSLSGSVWSAVVGNHCPTDGSTRSASDAQSGMAFFWSVNEPVWSVDAQGNCAEVVPSAGALVDISATQIAIIDGLDDVTLIDPSTGAQQNASSGLNGVGSLHLLAYSAVSGDLFAASLFKIYRSDSLGL